MGFGFVFRSFPLSFPLKQALNMSFPSSFPLKKGGTHQGLPAGFPVLPSGLPKLPSRPHVQAPSPIAELVRLRELHVVLESVPDASRPTKCIQPPSSSSVGLQPIFSRVRGVRRVPSENTEHTRTYTCSFQFIKGWETLSFLLRSKKGTTGQCEGQNNHTTPQPTPV